MPRHIHILTPGAEMRSNLWHGAYCRWYDNDRAGNSIKATLWGRVADLICPHA